MFTVYIVGLYKAYSEFFCLGFFKVDDLLLKVIEELYQPNSN